MKIKVINDSFSVLQVEDFDYNYLKNKYTFYAKTEDEISIVMPTHLIDFKFSNIENDFSMLKIEGVLDFSLIGIISKISDILAKNSISIFVVSTYNTDYFMVKSDKLELTIDLLRKASYKIEC